MSIGNVTTTSPAAPAAEAAAAATHWPDEPLEAVIAATRAGDLEATNELARRSPDAYRMDEGEHFSDPQLLSSLEAAAGRGFAPAQFQMGRCYEGGRCVTRDYTRAP